MLIDDEMGSIDLQPFPDCALQSSNSLSELWEPEGPNHFQSNGFLGF